MKLPPTNKEREVLLYISAYIDLNDYSPTRKEIGDRFGFTPAGAQYMVDQLRHKKLLRVPRKRASRNLIVLDKSLNKS